MRSVAPLSGKDRPLARYALELVFAAWGELQAGAGGEIDDGAGYEDLAGVGEGRDALGGVHGDPDHAGRPSFDLAGVEPCSKSDALLPCRVEHLGGAPHGTRWTVEGSESPIAGRFDDPAPVAGDKAFHRPVVLIEGSAPRVVATRRELFRGRHDVGEQHGRQDSIRRRCDLGLL